MFFRIGRIEVYVYREQPERRWAHLGVVIEGPSLEAVIGGLVITVSWGLGSAANTAYVWALRRDRPKEECCDPADQGPNAGRGATQA